MTASMKFEIGAQFAVLEGFATLERFVYKTNRWRMRTDEGKIVHYEERQLRFFALCEEQSSVDSPLSSSIKLPSTQSLLIDGCVSEPGLNGEYQPAGTFRGGKAQWMKPNTRCYIRWIRDRWELYVSHHPNGTTYFFHQSDSNVPPKDGWRPTLYESPDAKLQVSAVKPHIASDIQSDSKVTKPIEEASSIFVLLSLMSCIIFISLGLTKVLQWKTVASISVLLLSTQAPKLVQKRQFSQFFFSLGD
jgi:hypothetical protein